MYHTPHYKNPQIMNQQIFVCLEPVSEREKCLNSKNSNCVPFWKWDVIWNFGAGKSFFCQK